MKERPILFSGPMVRPVLAGTKTQTRRVVKPQPTGFVGGPGVQMPDGTPAPLVPMDETVPPFGREILCPYGQPGDRLWVREAFSGPHCMERTDEFPALPPGQWPIESPIWYWADGEPTHGDWTRPRPSIHMPRWASRITLEVTAVRVERLQDISADDARAEGCPDKPVPGAEQASIDLLAKLWFHDLWAQINGQASWDANPWVWVVEFRRMP